MTLEQTLLKRVDEQACIDFLAEMVRHRSYSETEGERELALFMQRAMREIGLESKLQPVTGKRVNAVGRLAGSGGGKSLLFNGHLDTNPATGGWTVDPWGAVVDGGCIHGIGVSNMKAGDAAFFCAVRTLAGSGLRPAGDVILTYVVGRAPGRHRHGARDRAGGARRLLRERRAHRSGRADPARGRIQLRDRARRVTRHVSKREAAVDAVAAAATLVPRLNAMTFSNAANDVHRSVNRANVGTIRGALSREFHDWRPPQVADFARLTGTVRYAPSQDQEGVLADLRALLDALESELPGLEATVRAEHVETGRPAMRPFEVDHDSRIVTATTAAYRRLRGEDQPIGALPPPCFYGTDAAHFQHLAGMEGIVCGPGGRYNTMPDERVELRDYLDAVRLYLMLIIDICGPVRPAF